MAQFSQQPTQNKNYDKLVYPQPLESNGYIRAGDE